ncbi:MAG: glucose-6-phosphate isomerase, partial [Candidatus Cloacimonetes bacterium]|nr:glucose-6-phosphate isomerase [Candidatus Cloacimonadota bacterium]
MSIKIDVTNLLHSKRMPGGIPLSNLEAAQEVCSIAHQAIMDDRLVHPLGFYELPDQDTTQIKAFAAEARQKFDDFVVLGIGGSALGNIALNSALKTTRNLDKRLFVADNVDPHLLGHILSEINLERTLFNVITKSGTTAETMSVFLIIRKLLEEKFPNDFRSRMVITTDREKGFLRKMVNDEGYSDFVVPDNVGGRFSIFTDVGLLSSAFLGIDIDALLAGAAAMRKRCLNPAIMENPAYMMGLLSHLFMKKGYNISV